MVFSGGTFLVSIGNNINSLPSHLQFNTLCGQSKANKLPLETEPALACNNTSKPGDQTFAVPYSTDNNFSNPSAAVTFITWHTG